MIIAIFKACLSKRVNVFNSFFFTHFGRNLYNNELFILILSITKILNLKIEIKFPARFLRYIVLKKKLSQRRSLWSKFVQKLSEILQ